MLDVRVELLHPEAIQLGLDRAGDLFDGQGAQGSVLGLDLTGRLPRQVERALVAVVVALDAIDGLQLASRVFACDLFECVARRAGIEQVRADVGVQSQTARGLTPIASKRQDRDAPVVRDLR